MIHIRIMITRKPRDNWSQIWPLNGFLSQLLSRNNVFKILGESPPSLFWQQFTFILLRLLIGIRKVQV